MALIRHSFIYGILYVYFKFKGIDVINTVTKLIME